MDNGNNVPPGPRGKFFTGNLAVFSNNPLDFLLMCSREYGDVVRIAKFTYLVNHPELIEQVFHDKNGLFEKVVPGVERKNHSAFPDAVMNSSGADWQIKRRKLQPAFHKTLIRENIAQTASIATRFLHAWRRNPSVRDIRQEMAQLSMEVGSRFLFGMAVNNDEMRQIAHMVEVVMALTRNQIRFPLFIPTRNNLRLRQARRDLDQVMSRIIERYRCTITSQTCLLGMLLEEDESGNSAWIRDELATMIMSGLEPMADALTWTCYLLALHPEVSQKLFDEAEAVIGGQGGISADNILTLRYTEAAVKEALRLYPPAWMTGRTVVRDCTFGGYQASAGVTLTVSQWVTHRDPRYFARPDEYCPERWLTDNFAATLPKYAYFPFGGGARKCIGNYLTMTQMITIVASIVHGFDIRLTSDTTVQPYPALVLRPLGVRMSVAPRMSSVKRS
ncbi:cytochrome P450 [Brenneria sp. g21c3]|uniref:cytochrome P450 n=1 Tax=Brenneria sp. g21c3 TaxID=3093893 RepID=UPI002EC809A7|nr:cytochrome P450 [Brenneria sp. g21c3]